MAVTRGAATGAGSGTVATAGAGAGMAAGTGAAATIVGAVAAERPQRAVGAQRADLHAALHLDELVGA